MKVTITPKNLCGRISAPPSKSYAHRAIIAACLSHGETVIKNVGTSDDVRATVGALFDMGFDCAISGADAVIGERSHLPKDVIFCNESGSTLRFLLPVAAALGIKTEFSGEKGLMKRPINELIAALNRNGADINGYRINGKLKSGKFFIDGKISSQYITGLMFALPLLDGDSEIVIENGSVSGGYLDITLGVLNDFGIKVEKTERGYYVFGGQKYIAPESVTVEGDYSGAAFYLAAGAIGGSVVVEGLKSNTRQGDAKIAEILRRFGARITVGKDYIKAESGELSGQVVDVGDIPDLAQILSVVAAFAKGKTVLKNTGRLKIKESDRAAAIEKTLFAAGIDCKVSENEITIFGKEPQGAVFAGAPDHRTVMAQTILATYARGVSVVENAQAVNKSYTDFFSDYKKLGGICDVDV